MNHSPRRGSLAHETLRLVFPPVADLDGLAGGWIGNRPRRAGPLTVRSFPAVNRLAQTVHLRSSPGVNIPGRGYSACEALCVATGHNLTRQFCPSKTAEFSRIYFSKNNVIMYYDLYLNIQSGTTQIANSPFTFYFVCLVSL